MRRHALLAAAVATTLAACAPALTGPQVGRIVNGRSGEEGTVSFTRYTLRPRANDPYAPDNATLQIGGQVYTGRTALVDSGVTYAPVEPSLGFGFDFGPPRPYRGGFFGFGGFRTEPRVTSRTGNLIARTAGNAQTITCTLTVDASEHGVGTCTGSDGTPYTLQF